MLMTYSELYFGNRAADLDVEPSLSPAHRALYDAGDRTQDFSTYIFLPIKTTLQRAVLGV